MIIMDYDNDDNGYDDDYDLMMIMIVDNDAN